MRIELIRLCDCRRVTACPDHHGGGHPTTSCLLSAIHFYSQIHASDDQNMFLTELCKPESWIAFGLAWRFWLFQRGVAHASPPILNFTRTAACCEGKSLAQRRCFECCRSEPSAWAETLHKSSVQKFPRWSQLLEEPTLNPFSSKWFLFEDVTLEGYV